MDKLGQGHSQSQGHVSQTHIFSILPEIWDDILSHLSTSDYYSLINSSPQWRLMFKSHASPKLLPLIIPILFNHCDTLLPNHLLKLRLINHQLKEFIDSDILEETPEKYYQNLTTLKREWSPRIKDRRNLLRNRVERVKSRYEFYSTRQIHQFTTTYSQLQCSTPFLTKSLIIPLVNLTQIYQNYQTLNALSTTMMEKLGSQICSITFDGLLGINAVHFFTLLNLLPNLKLLKIRGVLYPGQAQDVERCEDRIVLEKLELLDIEQAMDYEEEGNQMGIVCAAILRRCSFHLESLICAGFLFQNLATTLALQGDNVNLQKLKCLRVTAVNNEVLANIYNVFLQREHLPQLEMIELSGRAEEESVTFEGVFQILNKFATSLKHIQLNLNVWRDYVFEEEEDNLGNLGRGENGENIMYEKLTKFGTLLGNIDEQWFRLWVGGNCGDLRELRLVKEIGEGIEDSEEERIRRIFEVGPKLRKVVVFKGFEVSDREPEQRVFERDGSVRKFKFLKGY
ncbi:unnamed protein product [Orchesella dallaii]|uniref:F-box domain-containing protein n=1 Tax=Orchesella dallaii TaxID=48710 RepID=A0ABP1PIX1_9HEXA